MNRFSAWRAGATTLLSYRPTRLHKLAESIPWNRFLGYINVYKYGLCTVLVDLAERPLQSTIPARLAAEYTQSGNGRFLAYIPSLWKN